MQGQSQNKEEPGRSPGAPSPPLGFPPGQEQRLGSTLTLVSPGTPSGAEMAFSRSASFPTACLWWAHGDSGPFQREADSQEQSRRGWHWEATPPKKPFEGLARLLGEGWGGPSYRLCSLLAHHTGTPTLTAPPCTPLLLLSLLLLSVPFLQEAFLDC